MCIYIYNVYNAIMKTMCPHRYYHNGFVALVFMIAYIYYAHLHFVI